MATDLRLPTITAQDMGGKLMQIQSYLYQLVQDLNFILSQIESAEGTTVVMQTQSGTGTMDVANIFASIKTLLMRSRDLAESYYEMYKPKLDETYVSRQIFNQYTANISSILASLDARVTALENNP